MFEESIDYNNWKHITCSDTFATVFVQLLGNAYDWMNVCGIDNTIDRKLRDECSGLNKVFDNAGLQDKQQIHARNKKYKASESTLHFLIKQRQQFIVIANGTRR